MTDALTTKELKIRERHLAHAHETADLPIACVERRRRIETFEQANAAHRAINSTREIAIEIGRFLTE